MTDLFRFCCILFLSTALLSGCAGKPGAENISTLAPTIAIPATKTVIVPPVETPDYPVEKPALVETPGYPVETQDPASYPYPADESGQPPRVPARENASLVTAKLLEQGVDSTNPDLVRLHVLVTAVSEIAGIANMAEGLLNQETDLYAPKDILIDLQPGAEFQAEISLRGDEHGAKYYISRFAQ